MNEIQIRVIEIIKKNLEEIVLDKEITLECELLSLGVNSVRFIKTVVDIESNFKIEFSGDDLDYNRFKTIKDLCDYVSIKCENNAI